jgi:uncharacterized protein (TIGR00297 family)
MSKSPRPASRQKLLEQYSRLQADRTRGTIVRILCGLFLSSGIGLLAYRRQSLSRSGLAGAIATGTTTFGLGGLSWGFSLIFFFVSSSFFSHFREKDKAHTAADKFSKGSRRDLGQVIANGGIATITALGHGLTSSLTQRELLQAGYVGALATANADTWATELGILSTTEPRLITTRQRVSPGTSGGITGLGTTAAAGGALSLGLVFQLLQCRVSPVATFTALVSGLVGSLYDSLLGATMQATYYCSTCDKETEQRVHSCGTRTRLLRGLSWMNNDVVNFLATLVGGLVAIALHVLFRIRFGKQQVHS